MTNEYRVERAIVWRVVNEAGQVQWIGEYEDSDPLIFDTEAEAKDGLERLVEEDRRRAAEREEQRAANIRNLVPADMRVEIKDGKATYVANMPKPDGGDDGAAG